MNHAEIALLAQAPVERIEEVAGLYFRSVLLPHAGMLIDQHIHDHAHATYVGNGKARAWADGSLIGEYGAGSAIEIKAGVYHQFQALEDNTRLTCVHDIASAESIRERNL